MSGRIFISYRRDDSRADARSIYQHLKEGFGKSNLFMDVDTIKHGEDFTQALDAALKATRVMLVIVGPSWAGPRDDFRHSRIHDADDFVRQEVATALKRSIPVIPVCVDGAALPATSDLPEVLKPLAHRQAIRVTHESFSRDMQELSGALKQYVSPHKPERRLAGAILVALVIALTSVYGFKDRWRPSKPDSSNIEVCINQIFPVDDASGTAREYAAIVSRHKDQLLYRWAGGVAEQEKGLPVGGNIIDAVVVGDRLVIRYDWQNGVLQLRATADGLSTPYVEFTGTWSQRNGRGCAQLRIALPQLWASRLEERQDVATGVWSDAMNLDPAQIRSSEMAWR